MCGGATHPDFHLPSTETSMPNMPKPGRPGLPRPSEPGASRCSGALLAHSEGLAYKSASLSSDSSVPCPRCHPRPKNLGALERPSETPPRHSSRGVLGRKTLPLCRNHAEIPGPPTIKPLGLGVDKSSELSETARSARSEAFRYLGLQISSEGAASHGVRLRQLFPEPHAPTLGDAGARWTRSGLGSSFRQQGTEPRSSSQGPRGLEKPRPYINRT